MTVTTLLSNIATYILNPVIILGFTIATIFLFYGIAEMIWKSDGKDLDTTRKNVMWGILGLVIMFSVYGILRLALNTFGIPCSGVFFCKTN